METVEVVVRIPKKCKEFLDNGGKVDWLDAIPIIDAIANGTVLPKNHGRLIDVDKLSGHCGIHGICGCAGDCDNCGDYVVEVADIKKAPTIIEADKAEREDKE